MRIGIDGRVLTDGYPGIGRALYAVLPSLARQGEDIVLIAGLEPESHRFPLSDLVASGIEITTTPYRLRSVGEQLRLSATVKRLRLDVVLTPYFATALRWPCPRITFVQDLIPLTVEDSMPSRISRIVYGLLFRATLARSQMIVVPSQATAESLFGFDPRFLPRTRVIANAVDPRFERADRVVTNEVRSRYRLGPNHVLTVAGDRPHKNLHRLAAAWRDLDAVDRGDAVLVMAGSPSPHIEDPTVRVLGAVPERDLPALYTGALMVVVPSLEEGFGLPAAEAMACETAVVCSDRPALRELAGDAALYFDPRDRASIGAVLARALRDHELRRTLRQRGSVRVARFAPELIATQLLEQIRAVAKVKE